MTDKHGATLRRKDEVMFESGKVGKVVDFDRINERWYVVVAVEGSKLWASSNAVTKAKRLKVTHN